MTTKRHSLRRGNQKSQTHVDLPERELLWSVYRMKQGTKGQVIAGHHWPKGKAECLFLFLKVKIIVGSVRMDVLRASHPKRA